MPEGRHSDISDASARCPPFDVPSESSRRRPYASTRPSRPLSLYEGRSPNFGDAAARPESRTHYPSYGPTYDGYSSLRPLERTSSYSHPESSPKSPNRADSRRYDPPNPGIPNNAHRSPIQRNVNWRDEVTDDHRRPTSEAELSRYPHSVPDTTPISTHSTAQSERSSAHSTNDQIYDTYSPSISRRPSVGIEEEGEGTVAVLIMGLTGSGKSTFISLLADEPVQVGNDLTSNTFEITGYRANIQGHKVILIDTPGFDDTQRSDTEVLGDIAICLATLCQSPIKLIGVMYLHRITDIRMSGSAKKSIGILERLCGPTAFPRVVVVTNMWSGLSDFKEGNKRENQLKKNPDFFGVMCQQGTTFDRHDGSKESAESLMAHFIKEDQQVVLDIQKQLVDEGLKLEETPVGKFVSDGLLEQQKRYEKEFRRLEDDLREAIQSKDESLVSELKREQQKQQEMLEKLQNNRQGLKATLHELADRKSPEFAQLLRSSFSRDQEDAIAVRRQIAELRAEKRRKDLELDQIKERQREESRYALEWRNYERERLRLAQETRALEEAYDEQRSGRRRDEAAFLNYFYRTFVTGMSVVRTEAGGLIRQMRR